MLQKPHLGDYKGAASMLTVHSEVQARAEHVLMVLRVDFGRDDGAVLPAAHVQLVLAQRIGGQLACELDLVVDGAVLQRQAYVRAMSAWPYAQQHAACFVLLAGTPNGRGDMAQMLMLLVQHVLLVLVCMHTQDCK